MAESVPIYTTGGEFGAIFHAVEVPETVHSVNVPRSAAGLLVVTQLVVYLLKSYQSGWLMLHLEYASQRRDRGT